MQTTDRFWTLAGLGGLLSLASVYSGTTLFLVGAVGVYAWLVAAFAVCLEGVRSVVNQLTVTQQTDRKYVTAGERVTVSVTATLTSPVPADVMIDAASPEGAVVADGETSGTIISGNTEAEVTYTAELPLAGQVPLPPVSVTVTDPTGVVRREERIGTDETVVVGPNSPKWFRSKLAAFLTTQASSSTRNHLIPNGQDFADIREYVPGDPVRRIDWNATARFDRPFLAEFEPERSNRATVVLDTSGRMGGDRTFAYAREVALELLDVTESLHVELGLVAFDDEDVILDMLPSRSGMERSSIRSRIHQLPLPDNPREARNVEPLSPGEARRREKKLTGSDRFAESLRPFFGNDDAYVRKVTKDPLVGTVHRYQERLSSTGPTVLVTHDRHHDSVRHAVDLFQLSKSGVLVVLLGRGDDRSRARRNDLVARFATLDGVEAVGLSARDFEQARSGAALHTEVSRGPVP